MSNKKVERLIVDGITYVPESSIKATDVDGLEYVVVRTYSAGVFSGFLKSREGKEVVLNSARRLWYWDGACSLSQLAVDGVSKPSTCKFPVEVDEIILTEAIEITPATEKAMKSIRDVAVWKI